MRIAQVAPLQVAVPPHGYGGTERIVYVLTEELVRLGHDVTLFATADSRTSATLVPMLDEPVGFNAECDVNAFHVAMLKAVYTKYADRFDVIHSHLDYQTLPFVHLTSTPTVLTMHGRLDRPEWNRVFGSYSDANYVAISDDQRRHLPGVTFLDTVHHGIDLDSYTFRREPGDYLTFVGRMSPEKRPDLAIEVAKRCGIKIKVAAKVDHKEASYFKREIVPLLDHPLVEWLGEVDERQKCELMGNALALILPIAWPEPFGLVFVEALACGTPVITCPVGSVPELLVDGVTGFIGRNVDELVHAVENVRLISRDACRAHVERRFSAEQMARQYLRVYRQTRAGPRGEVTANNAAPQSSGTRIVSPGRMVPGLPDGTDEIAASTP
jgi:glycosyltransferase involved in cell wall biosynthesis